MRVLHTADIHLREYGDERWNVLSNLVDIGKKENIDVFAISGDLFDKETNAENLRSKIREVFSGNGYKVIMIPGNHDESAYKDMYFGEDAVVLTDCEKPFQFEGVNIWGIPFEEGGEQVILEKLSSLKGKLSSENTNIILYHGELLDAFFSRKDFGEEGEVKYMPLRLSYFKDINVDYVLGGHFHSSFDVRTLERKGYFVYPGSPISITRRELGQRKVNLFEVGKPPKEYLVESPHFQEIVVRFDPFEDKDPMQKVRSCLDTAHPKARIILKITGYTDSRQSKLKDHELAEQIRKIAGNCIEVHQEFRDIHVILEDSLFKVFEEKLERSENPEEKKKEMRDIAIRAMMEAKL